MMCQRCQGLMVSVTLEDTESTVMHEPTLGWRCVLCGEILDPIIAQHRKGPRKPPPRKPTPRHDTMVVVVGPANQWNKS